MASRIRGRIRIETAVARVDTDLNRDGVVDKRETFTAGAAAAERRVLSVVELDMGEDGRPTRRLHYAADGTLQRAEVLREPSPAAHSWTPRVDCQRACLRPRKCAPIRRSRRRQPSASELSS